MEILVNCLDLFTREVLLTDWESGEFHFQSIFGFHFLFFLTLPSRQGYQEKNKFIAAQGKVVIIFTLRFIHKLIVDLGYFFQMLNGLVRMQYPSIMITTWKKNVICLASL